MRFVGIDIGSERHAVAIVGEQGEILQSLYPLKRTRLDTVGFVLSWGRPKIAP